ncbi:MAG: FHA domain-containing protein, partial [Myxococcota bacterium]|nr:FHA domain-containing protein [Myxococcota bacterium]
MSNGSSGKLVLTFEIFRGDECVDRKELSSESITIGRGPMATLRVDDEGVEELHAVVNINDDGTVQVLDLGGPTGTKVNGETISNANLGSGDAIEIGSVRLVVTIVEEGGFEEERTNVNIAPPPTPSEHDVAATGSLDLDHHSEVEIIEHDVSEDVMAFIMRSGTATGEAGIDRTKAKVLEVAEIWGETVIDVKHFPKRSKDVTIGTSTGYRWRMVGIPVCWLKPEIASFIWLAAPTLSEASEERKNPFYVPADHLPHDDFEMFQWDGNQFICNFSDKWAGFVDIGDTRHSFGELIASGTAQAAGPGIYRIPVTDDTRVVADIGHVVFFGQMVYPGRKVIAPLTENVDYPFLGVMTFMMFVFLMLAIV